MLLPLTSVPTYCWVINFNFSNYTELSVRPRLLPTLNDTQYQRRTLKRFCANLSIRIKALLSWKECELPFNEAVESVKWFLKTRFLLLKCLQGSRSEDIYFLASYQIFLMFLRVRKLEQEWEVEDGQGQPPRISLWGDCAYTSIRVLRTQPHFFFPQ